MSDVLSFYRAMRESKSVIDQDWFAEAQGHDPLIQTPDGIWLASEASLALFNRLIEICRFLANHFSDETWSDAVVWVDLEYAPGRDRVCVLNEMLNLEPFDPFVLFLGERQLVVKCCDFEDKEVIS